LVARCGCAGASAREAQKHLNDLLEARQMPNELILTGVRLSADEETLLLANGDTTDRCETRDEVSGVVVERSSAANMRIRKADKVASAPVAASSAAASATAPPATMVIKGVWRPKDLDAPR
jgi:hypothetical protein